MVLGHSHILVPARQVINTNICLFSAILDEEVESWQEFRLTGLPGIQSFGPHEVL